MFHQGQQVRVSSVEKRVGSPRARQIEERLRSYIGQTGTIYAIQRFPGKNFDIMEVVFADGKEANIFRSTELEPVSQGES